MVHIATDTNRTFLTCSFELVVFCSRNKTRKYRKKRTIITMVIIQCSRPLCELGYTPFWGISLSSIDLRITQRNILHARRISSCLNDATAC